MKGKRRGLFLLLMLCVLLTLPRFAVLASETDQPETNPTETGSTDTNQTDTNQTETEPGADTGKKTDTSTTKKKNKKKKKKNGIYSKWIKDDGYCYFYKKNGKKAKGLIKINKKMYLFDKKGRQRHGWQKVDNAYYYFYLTPGKKGCMAKSTTVNGITLRKNGKAKVSSGNQKLYCLLKCSEIVENNTRPTWSKSQKMQTAWQYMQNNFGYWGVIWYNYGNWGVHYAYRFFTEKGGSCEGLGCAWAFLANACGAQDCYCVASGSGSGVLDDGHGWAEVEGLFYDPARARYEPWKSSFYGVSGLYPYRDWYHRYKV